MICIFMLIVLLVACDQEVPGASGELSSERCASLNGETADACRFALIQGRDVAGWPADVDCDQFSLQSYQDRCRMLTVEVAVLHNNDDYQAICDAIESDVWRWDCHFVLLEGSTDTLDPLTVLNRCQEQTGDLQSNCVFHVVRIWSNSILQGGVSWFSEAGLDAQLQVLQSAVHPQSTVFIVELSALLDSLRPAGEAPYCDRYSDHEQRVCRDNPLLNERPIPASPHWAGKELERWW